MIVMKDYIKTTLAVILLLGGIKLLHRLVMKCFESQYKLIKKVESWDMWIFGQSKNQDLSIKKYVLVHQMVN